MPEDAKDELSLNLAASYAFREYGMELSAGFGQGYKQPSMFALGHSLVGNPDLEPEYSEAIDIGLLKRWPVAGVELGVSLFHNEYRDLIDFDPVLFTNVNRGRVVTKGFDAQLGWQLDPDVELSLHVTHSDADIIGSDDELRRRPDWKGGAQLLWRLPPGVEWQTTARYNGRFFDSSVPTGVVEMPGYWAVDTTVGWTTGESVHWSLTVKNLLDDDFEDSVGFSNGGRAVGLSLRLLI
jgi:outer membrane cobalamin receptor